MAINDAVLVPWGNWWRLFRVVAMTADGRQAVQYGDDYSVEDKGDREWVNVGRFERGWFGWRFVPRGEDSLKRCSNGVAQTPTTDTDDGLNWYPGPRDVKGTMALVREAEQLIAKRKSEKA